MKKLYRKGKVHPSPLIVSDHFAFLPVMILTFIGRGHWWRRRSGRDGEGFREEV
uniref:Uncharacterized protein n=1 Tax=Nelumbo nucifera TaxID=4432 RepID=A0A822ZS47_NELNU|nr:TPA_asm: hypothetical protein HUJ06_017247 [Nelumbo nucifera]